MFLSIFPLQHFAESMQNMQHFEKELDQRGSLWFKDVRAKNISGVKINLAKGIFTPSFQTMTKNILYENQEFLQMPT